MATTTSPADRARGLGGIAVVTGVYWTFTLTDGALRMLVLLHLWSLGFSPFAVVSLFLLYELAGVVTTFVGGWLGARFGLKAVLAAGQLLQVAGLGMLCVDQGLLTVPWVMVAQGLSGIAKDLCKTGAKSYTRLVLPEGSTDRLLRLVALLTGSKNALKGAGFFVGGLLLATIGFRLACVAMAAAVALSLVVALVALPSAPGKARKPIALRALFAKEARLNRLSMARLFLFGSRDVWFVLAVPVFLAATLGWSFTEVGGFLALWVIGYGVVQALAPRWLGPAATPARDGRRLALWTASLLLPLGGTWLALDAGLRPELVLPLGLAVYGALFAVDSALHSYLVVAWADRDRVSLDVGFYYMANAAGRLAGTLLSGAVFQAAGQGQDGLLACVAVSAGFVGISALACRAIR
ncbi:MAG: organoarsenical effux MFS transporter ArsJ [Planctomycetota bacterium]